MNQTASSFLQRLLRMRRGPWENVAACIIVAGVFMLMQPFALVLYTYSFATVLFGTLLFLVVSHFPEG